MSDPLLFGELCKRGIPLLDIIEHYQKSCEEKGSIHLERKLCEVFSPKEFALKMYRGLPRVYRRDNPANACVKAEFSHLPSLKKLAVERFLWPLYEKCPIDEGLKVTLLTWVIADGWGDWIAAKEALAILEEKFPTVSFQWIALIPSSLSSIPHQAHCIYYEKQCPVSLFNADVLHALRSSDLIVSLPTYYPHTEELMKTIHAVSFSAPPPCLLCIGQYGYIESSWFHPKSGHRSMGLHFLEKGILLRKAIHPDFSALENQTLRQLLFSMATPTPCDVEKYLDSHLFYLAYLLTPVGGAVYLHALLFSLREDLKPIDICTPDLGWFIAYIERQKQGNKPVLEGKFGVQAIDVHYEGKIYSTRLAEQGKRVRILCPGPLSDVDFRLLVRMSGDFVGVRGDQSFSEVVSADRAFYYDGAVHARYFMKDLLALAENRLMSHRGALAVFRSMGQAFLHTLPEEKGEWVEETYFQEKQPLCAIAHCLGKALQNPDTLVGFQKFNRIVAEEHSFNPRLCQWIHRELVLRTNPSIAENENAHMILFSAGGCSLVQWFHAMQNSIVERK